MLPKAPCLLCVRSMMSNMPLSVFHGVFTRPLPGLCLWPRCLAALPLGSVASVVPGCRRAATVLTQHAQTDQRSREAGARCGKVATSASSRLLLVTVVVLKERYAH